MRPDGSRGRSAVRRFALALLATALFAAPPARGGLSFQPVRSLEGADASSIATDGTNTWIGTVRGVWLLSAGAWTPDGLSDRTVSSVAFAQGTAWAATDAGLYRRSAPGSWSREVLPVADAQIALVLADGDLLWAGGGGVFRRAGSPGSWTALPAYGPGFVTALGTWNGSLVAGLSFGGAVRWDAASSSWAQLWSGLGAGDAPLAFAVDAGSLVSGLARGLFTWTGAAWLQDAAFGVHDVRSLSTFGGVLRAATNDAGVLRRSGSTWIAESSGLVGPGARAFGVRGAGLLLATAGGPVVRWSPSGWTPEGGGLNASVVTSLPFAQGLDCWAPLGGIGVATAGAGFTVLPVPGGAACAVVPTGLVLPEGCGSAGSAALAPIPSQPTYVAGVATNCGVWLARTTSGSFVKTGLADRVSIGVLETTPNGLAGGTPDAGAFLYTGSSWSPLGSAFPASTSIAALRQVGSALWAGTPQGAFRKDPARSDWIPAGTGIPDGWTPSSFAGSDPLFAGVVAGGVFRRDGSSTWQPDNSGLQALGVYALASVPGRAWAAAGTAGVESKSEEGWRPETGGLPAGADVRAVGAWSVVESPGAAASTTSRRLFAGTAGHGLFSASFSAAVKTLPVVLDAGSGALRFRTELSLGNYGATARTARIRFVPAPGFAAPSGPVPEILQPIAAGSEVRIADAVEYLRGAGVPLPEPGPSTPIAGSLSVVADTRETAAAATDDLVAVARTYAGTAGLGTFGLCYPAPSDVDAAEESATVFGLRSVPGVSRSNLAVVHLPGRGDAPVTLEVLVFAEDGSAAPTPLSVTLAPGEWSQFNGVLEKAGLPSGSFGYARIRRVSGVGAWSAYGVVNDQRTNDGSFLPLYRPGGLAAGRRLVVPVVLDLVGAGGLPHYTTELTIANLSPVGTLVDLTYNPAPGFGTAPGVPLVTLGLPARTQRTIPDAIQFLRDNGVRVPDPAVAGPQGGTLYVDFRYLQNIGIGETAAMARTSTPNPDAAVGGSFGVFYPAAARGGGARTASLVPGLTRDANIRANLAVVHLGGGSSLPMTLTAQLYDAATGSPAGSPLSVTLNPGDWWQWSGVAGLAGLPDATTRFYAVVRRTAGDDTFLAYGVMNDSVTSDGSFLAGVPAESW